MPIPNVQIFGGNFQDQAGTPLTDGMITVALSHDEAYVATPSQVVGGLQKTIQLDNTGNIPLLPAVFLYSTDTLLPPNSYYVVKAFNSAGVFVWQYPQFWQFNANQSPLNVGTLIPINPQSGGMNGGNPVLQTNGINNSNQGLLNLQQGTNVTLVNLNGTTTISSTGGGGGGAAPIFENLTTDETGNSFYSVSALTNYFYASWQFVHGTTSYIIGTVFIPTAQAGAQVILDIASADSTAGHTANFQTSDGILNSGSINIGALTSAAAQTFTTTSTAYNRVTLSFNVQTTLVNNCVLVVKIACIPTGTQPTSNLLVYPHFIL